MSKRKGGNPANRTSGRVTPKGTPPRPAPGLNRVRDEAHRARVTGRQPSPTMRVHSDPRMTPAMLRAVLDELDRTNAGVTIPEGANR